VGCHNSLARTSLEVLHSRFAQRSDAEIRVEPFAVLLVGFFRDV
jgi:hypothetical protein